MSDPFPGNHSGILFFSSLLLSLWLTPFAIRLSHRLGAVDRPDERKVHTREVSRLGGVAMVAAVIVPLLAFRALDRTLVAFLAGALVVSLTGVLDDIFRLRPAVKSVGQVAGAAIFVFLGGISLTDLGDFLGTGTVYTGALAPVVTVFCMVGVMNALNLSDGLDGLAGGIAAIGCIFLGAFAYWAGDGTSLSILLVLFGAILGFLRYNSYPAHIFMGDAGSMLLGYSLAAATVIMSRGSGAGADLSPVTVAGILALPITDTLLVMFRRLRRGQNPFYPDQTHLHHRLMELGISHAAVVSILYIGTALFGCLAFFHWSFPEPLQFFLIVLLAAGIHGTVFLVNRAGWRWGVRVSNGRVNRRARNHRMARILGQSVRPMGWALGVAVLVPALAVAHVPRPVSLSALGLAGCVAFLYPWNRRGTHQAAVCYGLMYACCVVLLGIVHGTPGVPGWIPVYLAAVSAVAIAWVLLKMRYRGHHKILLFSSFEVLLIGTSFFVPLILVPAVELREEMRGLLLTVCLESVALLLAMKLLVVHRPRRNPVIAASLLAALSILALKGFFGDGIDPAKAGGDRSSTDAAVAVPAPRGAANAAGSLEPAGRPGTPAHLAAPRIRKISARSSSSASPFLQASPLRERNVAPAVSRKRAPANLP